MADSIESMYEEFPEIKGFVTSIQEADLRKGSLACTGPHLTEDGFQGAEILFSKDFFSKSNYGLKIVDLDTSVNWRGERWLAGLGSKGVINHEIAHAMALKVNAQSAGVEIGEKDKEKIANMQGLYGRDATIISLCYDSLKEAGLSPYLTSVIVLLASACDFVTIKSVMEFYLTEAVVIQVVITGAVAFILNYLPSLLGKTVKNKDIAHRKILIIVLIFSSTTLFFLTFLLRWYSRSMMFADSSNLGLLAQSAIESAGTDVAGENTLTVIMGTSTLFTSVLSFIFALLEPTVEEKTRYIKELRLIELEANKAFYEVHIQELQKIVEDDANAKREEEAYVAALKNLDDFKELFKEESRMLLAEHIGNPDAVSVVLQREAQVAV